jgi:E3 ubiquitin-protein ligase RNF115/126
MANMRLQPQIEDDHDPRDSHMFGHDGDQDDEDMPDLEHAPPRSDPPRYTAANDDPEEADISNFNFVRVGPGRFNVQATITRSVSPQALTAGMAPGSIGGFMSMLSGFTQTAIQGPAPGQGPSQGQPQPQGQGAGLFSGLGQPSRPEAEGQAPRTHTGRFTYHGGTRLSPRPDGSGMHVEPVDDISK